MSRLIASILLTIGLNCSAQDLIITGVIDGPLAGGTPKVVELYATADIADLSLYGIGSANNGGGTDGVEFELTGSASNGDFIYVATESPEFNNWFGFNPDFTSSAVNINGDDAIELFYDATGLFAGLESVIDVFGDVNVDGTGQSWEYTDGWAYRNDVTGPDGSIFSIGNWDFSGVSALSGESANSTSSTPFPTGSYSPVAGDNTAPVWSPSYPYLDNLTSTSFDIFGQIDEPGTIYYLVIPNDAIAPSSLDITTLSYAGTTLFSGSIPATTAFSTVSSPLAGLIEGFNYDVYVVAQDDESTPNVQFTPIKLDFPPELIAITEFMNNSLGTNNLDPTIGDETTNEWIELFNYGLNSVDLTGWTISDEDSDSDVIGAVSIDPGDYVILTRSKTYFETQWLGGVPDAHVVQLGITLADGADEIILSNNEGDAIWSLAYPGGLSPGSGTFLGYSENSSSTIYGSKASPGIVIGGDDASGSSGYENSGDPNAYNSTAGDSGSPLDGQYAAPLPVELLSFTGEQIDTNALLEWETVTETNNSGFEIHKSLDGLIFVKIGYVVGAGNSNEKIHYQFEDEQFYQSAYYQLVQFDYDGKYESSEVIYVTGEAASIFIFPNPIDDQAHLTVPTDAFEFIIQDLKGSIIYSGKITTNVAEQQLISLRKGQYFIDVKTVNYHQKLRVIRK
ncbi:Por secretion system C-terminal sorting domain-containing protein [Ekhidna lutea]|uniref:Por secretion system C-terminal sorting domain-containing protein n=1 Tax=Ekhidna lutea TaxID=447679 RepID=A0A239HHD4_EKHLU|nr:lamin tail domain-containing protein [Ekhidna lutea]SNS80233.1 Por secretion system C-terminal sorting domain-containing protein [Ekhidna lutea]